MSFRTGHVSSASSRPQGITVQVQAAYLPLPESQSICVHSSTFPCSASNVVEAREGHAGLGLLSELVWICGDYGEHIVRDAFHVDFHLVSTILAAPTLRFWVFMYFRHIATKGGK